MSLRSVRRASLGWACLALGLVSAACGARPEHPKPLDIAALRVQAKARPKDARLQRQLALAELLRSGGEPKAAQPQLERALALAPKDPALHLTAGLLADVRGQPGRALEHYGKVLELSATSTDPSAPHMAEMAAAGLGGAEDAVPGYVEAATGIAQAAVARPQLAFPARFVLSNLLIHLAYRQGDRPRAQQLATQLGCVTQMRAAGPFGPRELLGFDLDHGIKLGEPLGAQYDLGPDRGLRPTRVLGSRGCAVSLGGGPVARGGTTYVEAELQVPSAGHYLLRFETPNSAEVFLDGRSVWRQDRRKQLGPRVRFIPLELAQGTHLLQVKLSTRHPNPALAIALRAQVERDPKAIALPFDAQQQDGFPLYLRTAIGLVRGDPLAGRALFVAVRDVKKASAVLLLQRANALLADPLYPQDVREDEARALMLAALERDPELWNPALQLARMAASNGRVKEAVEAMRESAERWPQVPAVGLTLVELLRERDWNAEADRQVARLRKLVPDSCAVLRAQHYAHRRRMREREAAQSVEAIMACNAQSNARFSLLQRARQFQAAQQELERLRAMEPEQGRYGWLLAQAELARNQGDAALLERTLGQLRSGFPRALGSALEVLDRQLAAGQQTQARSGLVQALTQEPASMAALWRVAPLASLPHPLESHRRSGLQAIEDFESSGQTYEHPQVLVFDYMAVRVFEDGSSIELVHTVQKAQSDEAVDELAEVSVPEGAQILNLRTIKADGRTLEPDAISGKDTVSLPSVAPGDYVEFEYLAYKDPSDGFPDGYLGDRFYFKSFEVPFDYSHLRVIGPAALPLEVDPRGQAPQAQRKVEEGLQILDFKVAQSRPLVQEPGSVANREFIPSVRVGVGAGWRQFVHSIREALVDRDLYDPALAKLALQIVGDAGPDDHRLRAQRLYEWVLENVENNSDVFSLAPAMLRARTGNRTRVLHYLLGLVGVPSELGLVRSYGADATQSEMADADTYEHLLVRVRTPEPLWLYSVERWAPFGYMPALLRGQQALLLDAEAGTAKVGQGLVATDARQLELDVRVATDGSARIDVVETVQGSGAVSWRSDLEATPEAELQKRFEKDYVARLFPGATLASLKIEGREQQSATLRLNYSFDVEVFGRRVKEGWALPALLPSELAASYARVGERSFDQLLGSPVDLGATFRITLPAGARFTTVPKNAAFEGPAGSDIRFSLDGRFDKQTLVLTRRVQIPLGRVSPKAYPELAGFCRRVDEIEAKELVFSLP